MSKATGAAADREQDKLTGRKAVEKVLQPLPTRGALAAAAHRNLDLAALQNAVALAPRESDAPAVSYIVSSARVLSDGLIGHRGCGPNLAGGLITLTTCKRKMRAGLEAEAWPDRWVAGFTSRRGKANEDKRHFLFFLMQVGQAHPSMAALWHALPPKAREAKSARLHRHGDVYEPKKSANTLEQQWQADNYYPPCAEHEHMPTSWRNDIEFQKWRRHSPFLVGEPQRSFFWTEPLLCSPSHMTQGHMKWPSLAELVGQLEEA